HASFFVNGSRLTQDADAVVNARTVDGALVQNVATSHEHTNAVGRVDARPWGQGLLTGFFSATDDRETGNGVGGFTLADHGATPHREEERARLAFQSVLSPHLTHSAQVSIWWQDYTVGTLPTGPTIIVNGAFTDGPAATFRRD